MSWDISACNAHRDDREELCPARYECKRFDASFNKVPWQSFMETPEFGDEGCEMKIEKK